jgi:hypothetical protein
MDFVNSQHLTYQDGFLHVFSKPGAYTYRYLILPVGFEEKRSDSNYTIEVTDNGRPWGKGSQHDIVMRWDEKDHTYHAEPADLAIGVNDYVLWRVETQAAAIPSYSIVCESKDGVVFDSRALDMHDVFTHLFMTPGRYQISINYQAAGCIDVRDHRDIEIEAYDRQLRNAVFIRVLGGKIDPGKVDIVAGQTVIWFVEEGNKVTISAEEMGKS